MLYLPIQQGQSELIYGKNTSPRLWRVKCALYHQLRYVHGKERKRFLPVCSVFNIVEDSKLISSEASGSVSEETKHGTVTVNCIHLVKLKRMCNVSTVLEEFCNRCGYTMSKWNCKLCHFASIPIETNDKPLFHIKLFGNALEKFIQKLKNVSNSEVNEILFLADNLRITYND